jgi:hypothetical protein
VKVQEIEAIAAAVVLPEGATDLCMVVAHEPGGKMPDGSPSGIGGSTRFGPAWVIDGRAKSEPIALLDKQADARALLRLIAGEEGELWQRRVRRRERIAALDAAEAETERVEKENAKTIRRSNESGDGSSPPTRSSAKPTGTTGKLSVGRQRMSRGLSERTSSRLSSSSAKSPASSRGSRGRPTPPSLSATA